jgi:hypothetical protein
LIPPTPNDCVNYTKLIGLFIICATLFSAWYIYIEKKIIMAVNKTQNNNKITIKVLAYGFAAGWGLMFIPAAKTTLDVIYYNVHIDLYTPVNMIMLLGALMFGTVTGGIAITNKFKSNGENRAE